MQIGRLSNANMNKEDLKETKYRVNKNIDGESDKKEYREIT